MHLPDLVVIEKLETPEGWEERSESCFLWVFRLFLLVFPLKCLEVED